MLYSSWNSFRVQVLTNVLTNDVVHAFKMEQFLVQLLTNDVDHATKSEPQFFSALLKHP